jgi:hypothetical protein
VIYLPNENISDVSDYVNIEKVGPGRIYDLSFSVYMGILDQLLRGLLVKKLEEPYLSEKPYTRKYYLSQLRPIENLFKKWMSYFGLNCYKCLTGTIQKF